MKPQPLAYLNPVSREAGRPLRLAILGSTGSIGRQTIDLALTRPDLFSVTALTTNTRVAIAVELCRKVRPRILVVCDELAARDYGYEKIKAELPGIEVAVGPEAMNAVVERDDVDMVVTATVGYSGLFPTLSAIKAGKDVALANKETLVVAGDYIRALMAKSSSRIFPIDSEHSAIAQCLIGEDPASVRRLIITASGGPFRTTPPDRLADVTAADALKHPNWDMGAKITIDSATMMNKAFEIIEAHYLYGLESERIAAVVHPQSIIHSMVEFVDGAIKAQLGLPDMHLPIAYALGMNSRLTDASRPLDIADYATLTFEQPDSAKFPCLEFARLALTRRGNTACVINGANEIAVRAFLDGRIRFTDIYRLIDSVLQKVPFVEAPQPDDFVDTNESSRRLATQLIANLSKHYIITE